MLSSIEGELKDRKKTLKPTVTKLTSRNGEVTLLKGDNIIQRLNEQKPVERENNEVDEEERVTKPLAAFLCKTPVVDHPLVVWVKEPQVVVTLSRDGKEEVPLVHISDKERIYVPLLSDVGLVFQLRASLGDNVLQFSSKPTREALPPREILYIPEGRRDKNLKIQPGYFRVAQYNIMADMYTSPENFTYAEPSTLYWKFRHYNFKKEITTYDPDILCLQEVEHEFQKAYLNDFLEGNGQSERDVYQGVLKLNRRPEGCAIYWKKNRFNLIGVESQQYNLLATEQWKSETSKKEILYSALLNNIVSLTHHNTLAVVVLEDRETSKRFIVATTHLYWGGGLTADHYHQIQIMQIFLLTSYLQKVQQKYGGNLPIILTGDFNSRSDSGCHYFLQHEDIPPTFPSLTRNGAEDRTGDRNLINDLHYLKLTDAYSLSPNQRLTMTNVIGDFQGVIDYIWFSSSLLRIGATVEPYDSSIYLHGNGLANNEQGGLPNIYLPSDHISLFADFAFI